MNSSFVYYSDSCFDVKDIFGCVGLRKKQYCILNKQYSKEEYEKLVPDIIENMKKSGDWGNFFPVEMSPFTYNESIANEYMPLSKDEALAQGYKWREDIPYTTGQETMKLDDLPRYPEEYGDNLLNIVLACEKCNKNYRFIGREIGFYKRMKLAIPRKCFNCRHEERMKLRNPRELWDSKCANCSTDIKTSYPPERQKIYKIYCEACYNEAVY